MPLRLSTNALRFRGQLLQAEIVAGLLFRALPTGLQAMRPYVRLIAHGDYTLILAFSPT